MWVRWGASLNLGHFLTATSSYLMLVIVAVCAFKGTIRRIWSELQGHVVNVRWSVHRIKPLQCFA